MKLAPSFSALAAIACLTASASMSPATAENQQMTTRSSATQTPVQADFVLVDKSDRLMVIYQNGKAIRAYRGLRFGDAPMGHKRFQGDERTPEGRYTIDLRNPQSRFHLSMRISYPNQQDRRFASKRGRSPGGDIYIHGQPNGYNGPPIRRDWTDGCIALTNEQIEELWRIVPSGTPIEIRR